jgi:hypothetical protein
MTLTGDERERLEIVVEIAVRSIARDDLGEINAPDEQMSNAREFLTGFCAGWLYYDRQAGGVEPEEYDEIRQMLYQRSRDLSQAHFESRAESA